MKMTVRNKAFENLTPVEVVKERGFAGLLEVRTYLDRVYGIWNAVRSKLWIEDFHHFPLRV